MSTIASPREPSTPLRRNVSQNPPTITTTPTSSSRPSLDAAAAAAAAASSPSTATPTNAVGAKKANRAALREYYNLKKAAAAAAAAAGTDSGNSTPPQPPDGADGGHYSYSEVPPSALDAPDFDAEKYVSRALADAGLEELLRTYTRVLGETRALDAEKKALVYDNYSKLISATETIRKMRANMDPLNPMASTLDPALAQIYSQAAAIREAMRARVSAPESEEAEAAKVAEARRRARQLAREVLAAPGTVARLVAEGRVEDARREWEMPRRLLLRWRERGVGAPGEVEACLRAGDEALGGAEEEEEEEEEESGEESLRPSRESGR